MSLPRLVSPVAGTLSTKQAGRYGWRTHPVTGEPNDFHAGDDIACPTGTPIHAPEPGRIMFAGWAGTGLAAARSGLCVILRGDWSGCDLYFGHASATLVTVGQHVDQLDQLALSGATGNVTGPHVHTEVRTIAGTLTTTAPAAWYAARGVTLGTDPTEENMTPTQEAKLDALAAAVQQLAAAIPTEQKIARLIKKYTPRATFDSGLKSEDGKPLTITEATAHRWTHNTLRELRALIKEKNQ